VDRREEHARVGVEDLVGPVAVVHVPVEHEHALDAMGRLRVACRHGDVGEEAEAHRPIGLGVVARRPQGGDTQPRPVAEQRVDKGDGSTGAAQRRLPGPGHGDRVGVDAPATAGGQLLQSRHERLRVHRQQLLAGGGRRVDRRAAEPVVPAHLGLERADAGGALGMTRNVVGQVRVMAQPGGAGEGHRGYGKAVAAPADPRPAPADLVVVGAGAAGLYAALCAAREGARVALVSARPLAETASYWAQGGLAAALAEDDSPGLHLEDTLTAGRGLVRRSAAEVLCDEAPERFRDLEALGVRFDADRHGTLALGLRAATACAASPTRAAARQAAGSCASSPPMSRSTPGSTCSRGVVPRRWPPATTGAAPAWSSTTDACSARER
jgi:hypothetical protein